MRRGIGEVADSLGSVVPVRPPISISHHSSYQPRQFVSLVNRTQEQTILSLCDEGQALLEQVALLIARDLAVERPRILSLLISLDDAATSLRAKQSQLLQMSHFGAEGLEELAEQAGECGAFLDEQLQVGLGYIGMTLDEFITLRRGG